MQYEIKGEPMPVVVCQLDSGEAMITEILFSRIHTPPRADRA